MSNLEWRRRRRSSQLRTLSIGLVSFLVLIGIWYVVTDVADLVQTLFLPSPVAVFDRLTELLHSTYQGQTLIGHMLTSLRIVVTSWILGGIIGIPIGVAMGWFRRVRTAVSPIFELIRPVPPIAWISLSILWFGLGDPARIFVVSLSALVPWVLNSYEAVIRTDPLLVKASRSLGATGRVTLSEIVLPASLSTLVGGARIALGNAWMTIVAAELLGATAGLGFVVLEARSTFDTDIMLSGMILIGILGIIFSEGLRLIERSVATSEAET